MSAKANALMNKFGANIAQTVANRPVTLPGSGPAAGDGPDRYAGAVKSRTFAEMPVDAILAGPQPRTEFDADDLARLAASIKRFGQLAPIRVRRDEGRGAWVVLVGERRLRACKLAGLERVRVEFVERAMAEADVLAEQVVENAVRSDLQPVEQARAYKRLLEVNGWNAQQLAETLGVEPTAVYRALALLKLPEEVAALVDSGEIKPTAAYEISKLAGEGDQRALAERVVADGLDHKATVAEVTRRKAAGAKRAGKAKAKPAAKAPAEERYRGPRGVRLTVQATARHTVDDVVADLRAIADRLEAAEADAA